MPFDSTVRWLNDPYRFISRECRVQGKDFFETRLFLKKTVCMTGKEAAELFYGTNLLTRKGAAPEPVRATLFGKGGIQGLDGNEHLHRKKMFMAIMSRENLAEVSRIAEECWRLHANQWISRENVILYLYEEAQKILAATACRWAGIPMKESDIGEFSQEVAALFDAAGAKGPRHLRARWSRKKWEHHFKKFVETVRDTVDEAATATPAEKIAWHRDSAGELLSPRIAAVEILNLVRPMIAVSVYIVFLAHALHTRTGYEKKVADPEYAEFFVHEVRRFYPFFPAVMAKVRGNFVWKDFQFTEGMRVVLDLYGTNRDARIWEAPEEFRPERFRNWDGSPFTFIPQGGGDHLMNHRCPGEWMTIELMKVSLQFLALNLKYDVPDQDMAIDWLRLPPVPRDRFAIAMVSYRNV